jgi:hypothetical protein
MWTFLVIAGFFVLFHVIFGIRQQGGLPGRQPGAMLFRHGLPFRIVCPMLALGCPIALAVVIAVGRPPDADRQVIAGVMAAYVLLGTPVMVEAFRLAVATGSDGLDCRPAWGRRRFVPWDDVVRVTYSKLLSAFVIHTSGGWTMRVPYWVPGIGQLLEVLEQHLDPKAFRGAKDGYQRVGRRVPRGKSSA